jgi:hypothetical protein
MPFGCGGEDGSNGVGDTTTDGVEDTTTETAGDTDGEPVPCTSDSDCDDGIYCNGVEICGVDGCRDGTAVDCGDGDPCTMDSCNEGEASCDHDPLDEDGDGFVAADSPGGHDCGGNDCDDAALDIYPGAPEDECDFVDKDCDGDISEYIDDDGDQYIDDLCDDVISDPGDDFLGLGDCDDDGEHLSDDPPTDPDDIHPGAPEGCDDVDNDCDGTADDIEADSDGDGYAALTCTDGNDCDDTDPDIHPGADEVCDLVDDDCDDTIFDAAGIDDDLDDVPDVDCGGNDCDDGDDTIHGAFDPSTASSWISDDAVDEATETCDTIDQDCDTEILDAEGADDDGDEYLDEVCGGDDCNDLNPDVYPGAPEDACDSVDNDCDGDDIDGVADDDDDDYIDDTCTGGTDCDDTDPDIHPDATPVCDTVDDDCSGSWRDEAGADDDDDGHLDADCGGDDCDDTDAGVHTGAARDCGDDHDCDTIVDDDSDEDGHTWDACGGDDCNDDDASIHGGAPQIVCDGVDNDCNGYIDSDNDGDGFQDDACAGGTDCDDDDASIHPGASAVCDYVDDDCSGFWYDEAGADDDGDEYLDEVCGGDDCDDESAVAYPGATEICNDGIDGDCDGSIDGPIPLTSALAIVENHTDDEGWLTWTGSEFGLAYQGQKDGTDDDPMLARIAEDGTVVATDIDIMGDDDHQWRPRLAWSGSELGFAWFEREQSTGDRTVHFARTDPLGARIGGDIVVSGSSVDAEDPSIVWAGSQWGIAWRYTHWPTETRFSRVSETGTMSGTTIKIGTDPMMHIPLGIVWTGSEFGTTWLADDMTYGTTQFRRMADSGMPQIPVLDVADVPDHQLGTDLAWSGSEFGVLWTDNRSGDWEIYFNRIGPAGIEVGSDVRVLGPISSTSWLDIIWTDAFYVATWTDNGLVYMASISPLGGIVGSSILVSEESGMHGYSSPVVAWTGSSLGVVWHEQSPTLVAYMRLYQMCD